MEVIYYVDSDLNICPVKKYLERFSPNKSDNAKTAGQKTRILANIDQKIRFVQENPRRQASFLSPLHNHHFIEIKNGKDSTTIIRILFFIHNNKIVLLNAFEKPNKYDTTKARKEVEKHYITTDKYLIRFKEKPNYYQNYE